MCPHCGKNAPVVHRGLAAYCTACGRPRMPFTDKSVSLAGKPSKVGGLVAGVFGWLALIGGVSLALLLGLLGAAIFPGTIVGLAVGLPIGLASLAVGLMLLLGGRKLARSGASAAREARIQAIFSLAANRGGAVTAQDVASALDIPTPEADALLTDLAKERSDDVTVEIGERGEIYYAFPGVVGRSRTGWGRGVRFPQQGAGPRLRVDAAAGWDAGEAAEATGEDGAAEEKQRRQETLPRR